MMFLFSDRDRARFESRFTPEPNTGCWLWSGVPNADGYGQFFVGERNDPGHRNLIAHRASWEMGVGEIPDGAVLCHRCDNPACVNPAHLFLGGHCDNRSDCIRKGRARYARGEKAGRAVLTEDQVHEVRALFRLGISKKAIARRFGVNKGAVYGILKGQTWAWLKTPGHAGPT